MWFMNQKWIFSILEFVSIFSVNIALVLSQNLIYYIISYCQDIKR